jgi:hypothetical protein
VAGKLLLLALPNYIRQACLYPTFFALLLGLGGSFGILGILLECIKSV